MWGVYLQMRNYCFVWWPIDFNKKIIPVQSKVTIFLMVLIALVHKEGLPSENYYILFMSKLLLLLLIAFSTLPIFFIFKLLPLLKVDKGNIKIYKSLHDYTEICLNDQNKDLMVRKRKKNDLLILKCEEEVKLIVLKPFFKRMIKRNIKKLSDQENYSKIRSIL
jgi:hypothetical protein